MKNKKNSVFNYKSILGSKVSLILMILFYIVRIIIRSNRVPDIKTMTIPTKLGDKYYMF